MGNQHGAEPIGLPGTDQAKLHVLFLSCVRFVVEKHGGIMRTDPQTLDAVLDIPERTQDACFEELGQLLSSQCLAEGRQDAGWCGGPFS